MSSLALGLVVASAVAHATWNLIAKRVAAGATFVWLFDAVSVLLVAPVAAGTLLLGGASFPAAAVAVVAVSATMHLAYFVLLTRGYRHGELSLVYPLSRGTGPLLAAVVGIAALGERPHPAALAGALLIVACAVGITGDVRRLRRSGASTAVGYAVATGCFIAAYTILDKVGVSNVGAGPVLYLWGLTAVRLCLLTPWAATHRDEVVDLWRRHRRSTIAVSVLSSLAYVLVLAAFTMAPVSVVAPAREIGILFGAAMGATLLAERDPRRRLAAAGGMVAGVALLAVG